MEKVIMTNSDCLLEGKQFDASLLKTFNTTQLSSIVGEQSPNGYLEDLSILNWHFQHIEIEKLRTATEYYEEPEGGWKNAYLRFIAEDNESARYTPEYAGRDNWIKNEWCKSTETYPLYVILEDNNYRLLDGHHRLAGAFYYDLKQVAVILGIKL